MEARLSQKEKLKRQGAVLTMEDVSFTSIDRTLFYDVNLTINRGENVVVTGKTGVGKSVLLKLVTAKEQPDTGKVNKTKDVDISYVPQDVNDLAVEESATIRQLFWKSRGLDFIEHELGRIERLLDSASGEVFTRLIDEQSELLSLYEQKNGYTAENEMNKILRGLELDQVTTGHITPDTPLTEVSSGQKTRILLGQALFAQPDLLVLDDPTSHLDQESVTWLVSYLRNTRQASLIATNDVDFMNRCADKIVEITDFGRVLSFEGNYHEFVVKRDEILASEKKEADTKKDSWNRLHATFRKFKDAGNFKRSKDFAKVGAAMQTRLARMQREIDNHPGSRDVFRTTHASGHAFYEEHQSGDDVLFIDGPAKMYGDFIALNLEHLQLMVTRGEKILIVGENGSGKSTLMHMIASVISGGNFTPNIGEIKVGQSITSAFCSPDNLGIALTGTPLEAITQTLSNHSEGEAASMLGFWGFTRDMIRHGRIEFLSQGEKKRLALATIMAKHPNLILLDEPTNYLETDMKDRLISALESYEGTLILITHDQSFLEKLKLHKELQLPQGKIKIK